MFRLMDVTKSFGAHRVVRSLSLDLEPGVTAALIGPSGCGKSTLLRLMMGLVTPEEGTVLFRGERVHASNARMVCRNVGYAIQSGGLFPHMTALQNIELPARYAGWEPGRRKTRTAELMDMMHMTESLLRKYPRQLSGGQRQRAALMRALVLDPQVLLLDEPLGALDPVIRSGLQQELRELFAKLGKTVVLVTHDLAEAAYLAPDDVVLMRSGEIAQRGALEALRSSPASGFVSEFINAQTARVTALLGATP